MFAGNVEICHNDEILIPLEEQIEYDIDYGYKEDSESFEDDDHFKRCRSGEGEGPPNIEGDALRQLDELLL